jgi:hypothetical protein
MKKLVLFTIGTLAIAINPLSADHTQRRTASFTSNQAADSGSCTVEVVVPGEARIKIEGNEAKLEKISGREPEFRRFECTSPVPEKPVAFRTEETGGRGHMELVHGPRHHGGDAVISIRDSKHGEDAYTFNLVWGGVPAQQ